LIASCPSDLVVRLKCPNLTKARQTWEVHGSKRRGKVCEGELPMMSQGSLGGMAVGGDRSRQINIVQNYRKFWGVIGRSTNKGNDGSSTTMGGDHTRNHSLVLLPIAGTPGGPPTCANRRRQFDASMNVTIRKRGASPLTMCTSQNPTNVL